MEHRVSYKVYYEDTDCLGVVYYANYLRFMERGRTEYLAARGQDVAKWNQAGFLLVVHSLNLVFRRPARLGDRLDVVSTFALRSPVRGVFQQRIERDGILVTEAEVVVVCLDADQRPIAIPAEIRALGEG